MQSMAKQNEDNARKKIEKKSLKKKRLEQNSRGLCREPYGQVHSLDYVGGKVECLGSENGHKKMSKMRGAVTMARKDSISTRKYKSMYRREPNMK